MVEEEKAAAATGSTTAATITTSVFISSLLIAVRLTCDLDICGYLCLKADFINENSRNALIIIFFHSRWALLNQLAFHFLILKVNRYIFLRVNSEKTDVCYLHICNADFIYIFHIIDVVSWFYLFETAWSMYLFQKKTDPKVSDPCIVDISWKCTPELECKRPQSFWKTNMTTTLILCYWIMLSVCYLCEVSRVKIFFKEMFIFGQAYWVVSYCMLK